MSTTTPASPRIVVLSTAIASVQDERRDACHHADREA
jgi:hypothetical protein